MSSHWLSPCPSQDMDDSWIAPAMMAGAQGAVLFFHISGPRFWANVDSTVMCQMWRFQVDGKNPSHSVPNCSKINTGSKLECKIADNFRLRQVKYNKSYQQFFSKISTLAQIRKKHWQGGSLAVACRTDIHKTLQVQFVEKRYCYRIK